MVSLLLSNINSLLELFIFLVTITIGGYTFRIHQVTKDRKHKLLGIGFILIGLSYLTKACLNLAVNNHLIALSDLVSVVTLLYSAFLLFGYTVLVKLFLDIRTYKVFSLQIILFGLALFLIQLYSLWFLDLVGFLLLGYPVYYFLDNYVKKKSRNSLLILLSFAGLMFSHASFFLIFINKSLFFADNLIRLIAYAVLLAHYVLNR